MNVSLVMIGCDVGKILGRSLDSVRDFVDEIIFVDTGSEDDTKEIARDKGAVVLDFNPSTHPTGFILDVPESWKRKFPGPFTGKMRLCDFAAARQFGWDRAKSDFIMWLDCDDVVEGAAKIGSVVADMRERGLDSAMLNYDYAQDDNGNVTMRLPRERIVRRGASRWVQPVHEVLVPEGKSAFYSEPNVVHLRGKDNLPVLWHNRNLKILTHWEENTKPTDESIDPRMLFYMGMEERWSFPEDALKHFALYVKKSGWDEEKALAYCLSGAIYEGMGKYHEAMREFSMSTMEFKKNPDGLLGNARCAYYLRNWSKTIEWTNEAFKVMEENKGRPSMLMEDLHDRAWHPYVYLSVAFYNTSQFEKCIAACKNGLKIMPSDPHLVGNLKAAREQLEKAEKKDSNVEMHLDLKLRRSEPLDAQPLDIPSDVLLMMALQIWKRCESPKKKVSFTMSLPESLSSDPKIAEARMMSIVESHRAIVEEKKTFALPDMTRVKMVSGGGRKLKIGIWTGPAWEKWSPNSINNGGIGGSETAVVHMARELSKRGHEVHVFATWDGFDGGVQYTNFEAVKGFSGDVLVSSRQPVVLLEDRWNVKASFVWAHDIHVGQSPIVDSALLKADGLLALSSWHAKYMRSVYPFLEDGKVFITRNGIDVSRFAAEPVKPSRKLIYTSSPDRGLMRLLQLFPRIRVNVPDAELHVYYGFYNWKSMSEATGNQAELDKIKIYEKVLSETAGVFNHGRVGQQELADAFLSSRVWGYPTWFSETSCITAMEAQAAGCVPVTSNVAALAETVKHGVLLEGGSETEEFGNKFVREVSRLLRDDSSEWETISSEARRYAMANLSWKGVAADWEKMFFQVLDKKDSQPSMNGDLKSEGVVTVELEDQITKEIREVTVVSQPPRLALMYGLFSSGIHGKFDIPSLWENAGLTGSESCCFNMAKAFAEAGCQVDVFCDVASKYQAFSELSGAHVYPIDSTRPDGSYDAYLAWNEPDLLRNVEEKKLRICVQQLNDFSSYSQPGFDSLVDAYVMPSKTLGDFLVSTEKISSSKINVIPNSINLEFYEKKYKRGKTIVWCSSPDRGLHVLLPIFEKVRKRIPDVTLKVFYRYDKWIELNIDQRSPSGDRARMIEEHLSRVGRSGENGVIMFDSVSNRRMARELLSSKAFAYTCEPVRFTEGFSVSIMDACAAGCAPVISDADALPEIYGEAAHIIKGKPSERMDQWVTDLCRIFEDEAFSEELSSRARAFVPNFSRKIVAGRFLKLIEEKRKEKENT